ncbi:hypothetical protein [Yoonia sp.]|uniref:hypothetical protein n=1 Tax=Yoonia sp. TaxID=2212373 RepID=UPI0025E6F4FF|nr:hypothetical protein [Yoonia sp.]
MKVISSSPDSLVLQSRPRVAIIFLAGMTLGFLALTGHAISIGEWLASAMTFALFLILGAALVYCVEWVTVRLNAESDRIEIHRRGWRAAQTETYALSRLSDIAVTSDIDGGVGAMVWTFTDTSEPLALPLTQHGELPTYEQAQALVDRINDWRSQYA